MAILILKVHIETDNEGLLGADSSQGIPFKITLRGDPRHGAVSSNR